MIQRVLRLCVNPHVHFGLSNICRVHQAPNKFLSPCRHNKALLFKRDIHPLFWPVIRVAAKLGIGLTSRAFRNRWRKLSNDERKYLIDQYFTRKRLYWGLGAAGVLLLSGSCVYNNTEVTPFTKRRRWVSVKDSQLAELNNIQEIAIGEMAKGHILPTDSQIYKTVARITKSLLDSNQDIEAIRNTKWELTVIDANENNAFVLPNGHIYFFTGFIRSSIQNEHQLAFVLAHELSHVLLRHAAEKVSKLQLKEVVDILLVGLVFFGLSDALAFLSALVLPRITEAAVQPYSRTMETEADEVGLMLTAKACFDVREASALWSLMSLKSEVESGRAETTDFWASHPSFKQRALSVGGLTQRALETRRSARCAPVRPEDPNHGVEAIRRQLQNRRIPKGSKVEILKDEKPGKKAVKITVPQN